VENLIKEEFSASSVALDVEQEFELLRQRVESLDDEKVGQQDLERIISDSRELITHTTTANFEPFEKGMIERIGSLKEEALRWVNETNDKIRSLLVGQADQAAFVRESNDRIHEIIKAHLSGDRVVHAQDVDEVSRRLNDELYQEFEDRYRGSEDEIKRRLQPYVDIIREGNKGTISTPVLDIGCGRGEWLDLLKENGFVSEGVDVSPKAVERSQRKGLRVTCADGVEYLAGIDDNSVGVITAFHVVEHLTFNDLQTFLRVAHRKLSSGGFIILETPNPENVQVGTNWFYTDPTHIRPMTPDLLKFLVEYTGFGMTDVLRLNPIDAVDVKGMGFEDLSPGLMRLICGERDFSVVARKVSR
jgi:O-antigen chain-terminating methyltransferase